RPKPEPVHGFVCAPSLSFLLPAKANPRLPNHLIKVRLDHVQPAVKSKPVTQRSLSNEACVQITRANVVEQRETGVSEMQFVRIGEAPRLSHGIAPFGADC